MLQQFETEAFPSEHFVVIGLAAACSMLFLELGRRRVAEYLSCQPVLDRLSDERPITAAGQHASSRISNLSAIRKRRHAPSRSSGSHLPIPARCDQHVSADRAGLAPPYVPDDAALSGRRPADD